MAWELLQNHRLFELLQAFHPLLAGTVPLRIDIEDSDPDILCRWQVPIAFQELMIEWFQSFETFELERKNIDHRDTVICRFRIDCFPVEIFGQHRPITTHEAWRHMIREHDLLNRYVEGLRREAIRLKRKDYNTEPAFAKAFQWKGDPYELMLNIERPTDGTAR